MNRLPNFTMVQTEDESFTLGMCRMILLVGDSAPHYLPKLYANNATNNLISTKHVSLFTYFSKAVLCQS